jgi:hypothetical protein
MSFEAIRNLYPQVTNLDEKYGYFDVDGKEVEIDSALVDKEVKRLQDAFDAQAYARNRQRDYPNWGTQLNKIYDDGVTKWKSEMVDPVKAKWPKDNSGPVE